MVDQIAIDGAIGLFHVHAHKDKCFFYYASTFIPGSAIVSGKILESLWSNLNIVSHSVCTATLVHCVKVFSNHCNDGNHKKALAFPRTLCERYYEARQQFTNVKVYFDDLTDVAGAAWVKVWKEEIEEVEAKQAWGVAIKDPHPYYHCEDMDIYGARLHKAGQEDLPWLKGYKPTPWETWLDFALDVEEKQCVSSNHGNGAWYISCRIEIQFQIWSMKHDSHDANMEKI